MYCRFTDLPNRKGFGGKGYGVPNVSKVFVLLTYICGLIIGNTLIVMLTSLCVETLKAKW